jgi:hypothetical protein
MIQIFNYISILLLASYYISILIFISLLLAIILLSDSILILAVMSIFDSYRTHLMIISHPNISSNITFLLPISTSTSFIALDETLFNCLLKCFIFVVFMMVALNIIDLLFARYVLNLIHYHRSFCLILLLILLCLFFVFSLTINFMLLDF